MSRPHTTIYAKKIDNPDWAPDRDGHPAFPRKVHAPANANVSVVEALAKRKKLSEVQKEVADRFSLDWEMLGHSGAKAINFMQEPVSASITGRNLGESVVDAGKRVRACRAELGTRNFWLVTSVCRDGKSFDDLVGTRRERESLADRFRDSLDDIAPLYGFANRRRG